MNVILVDDERLALIGLEKMLEKEVSDIQIVASYMNPTEVIAGVMLHQPDVVFLDIHMPEIDGMDLGRQIQKAVPGTEIIFVTSYDQYAVHAFELQALDYVMKPVQKERLKQTLQRVREKLALRREQRMMNTEAPLICCFNQISFKLPGKEAQVAKWRTSKAQELFAYLLHHRNQIIHRSALLDLLWPGTEEEKVAHQLYTTMYHVRQTLKTCGMETISIQSAHLEAGYKLELGDARLDSEQWEQEMKAWKEVQPETVQAYEQSLYRYTGTYLGRYDYMWAEPERERLRYLWLYYMRQLNLYYLKHGQNDRAIENIQQIQQMLPDDEESYFMLMKLYDEMQHKLGVEEQYRLVTSRMEQELGIPISEEVQHWYRDWKRGIAKAGQHTR
ncbi:response regulator [Paenibacillus barcinonensis]|uniref:Response regulator n=1 Tax=Paenibacillus barcinonensis TaxID=198119 RepID=A0A2V4VR37_PAEBA|nr:response regulator [Paenibacillus barcinonensis]PYE48853.1 two-component SAPR family response regulator [Paenibacillus barcinonensis]QKS57729.1 response regulator [Paenibacillus barcinonensis]